MGGEAAESVGQTLAYVLERSLRLLHPFAPFATEILWQSIPHTRESIMMAPWPTASERDQTSEAAVSRVIEIVTKVRNARSESTVEPGRWIAARISAPHDRDLLESVRGEISTLARIADDQLAISIGSPAPEQTLLSCCLWRGWSISTPSALESRRSTAPRRQRSGDFLASLITRAL
jgi:valyl-tRNA synthetase